MKHKLIERLSVGQPYEIIRIELVAENPQEISLIKSTTQAVGDYLTLKLSVVEIIDDSEAPVFVVKRVKDHIGFGD